MTMLPRPEDRSGRKLGLVIDLDTCVGCHACVIACKGWNDQAYGAPLSDSDPYGDAPSGSFLNRVHSYEVAPDPQAGPGPPSGPPPDLRGGQTPTRHVHFPKSCLHCDDAPCVPVCPTGASYKRAEDGIVLVNEDACIGCGLCAWACPYGAREMDPSAGVMKKCTLCVDRIYNETLPEEDREPACVRTCPAKARHFGDLGDPGSAVSQLVEDRGGVALMPELGAAPVNRYLPPRERDTWAGETDVLAPWLEPVAEEPQGFLGWLDRTLGKL
ncbi:ferredoxin [Salipiger pallidus]|uniref:Ferredoxin n=1 Tax=Salipiger pallidus TaxID=1775170 RepID=A0A8J3EHH2_9RHOB|nr:4Fe-4S dicluster domain-containing protein [Salipiger pallidus]GGG78292.1 ferredoxin [Salipiger pallidus]